MATISVARGLAESKLLKVRIEKETRIMKLIAVKMGDKLQAPYSSYNEADFIEQAKATLQSINDMYDRLIRIQNAIKKSNGITMVTIGKHEMTVQEAITMKDNIGVREDLLQKLKTLVNTAESSFNDCIKKNENAIESLVNSSMGKDVPEAQKTAIRKDAEDFIEKNKKVAMVDPCDLRQYIKSLEDEIDEFKTNVDYALSESNSTTMIEVD